MCIILYNILLEPVGCIHVHEKDFLGDKLAYSSIFEAWVLAGYVFRSVSLESNIIF